MGKNLAFSDILRRPHNLKNTIKFDIKKIMRFFSKFCAISEYLNFILNRYSFISFDEKSKLQIIGENVL